MFSGRSLSYFDGSPRTGRYADLLQQLGATTPRTAAQLTERSRDQLDRALSLATVKETTITMTQ